MTSLSSQTIRHLKQISPVYHLWVHLNFPSMYCKNSFLAWLGNSGKEWFDSKVLVRDVRIWNDPDCMLCPDTVLITHATSKKTAAPKIHSAMSVSTQLRGTRRVYGNAPEVEGSYFIAWIKPNCEMLLFWVMEYNVSFKTSNSSWTPKIFESRDWIETSKIVPFIFKSNSVSRYWWLISKICPLHFTHYLDSAFAWLIPPFSSFAIHDTHDTYLNGNGIDNKVDNSL